MLESLDYQMEETGGQMDHLSMKPSEYFRRQVYACFWFEGRSLEESIRRVGVENCMFETDFPHPTCLYPDPLGHAAESLTELGKADLTRWT